MSFRKIKKIYFLIIFFLSSFLIFFIENEALAQSQLRNPLTGTTEALSPEKLYGRIIRGFLGVIGALSLVMFIWGGFLWLTSGGSPEKVKKGKDTLVWAIIGLMVTFGSYIILSYVISAITGATQ